LFQKKKVRRKRWKAHLENLFPRFFARPSAAFAKGPHASPSSPSLPSLSELELRTVSSDIITTDCSILFPTKKKRQRNKHLPDFTILDPGRLWAGRGAFSVHEVCDYREAKTMLFEDMVRRTRKLAYLYTHHEERRNPAQEGAKVNSGNKLLNSRCDADSLGRCGLQMRTEALGRSSSFLMNFKFFFSAKSSSKETRTS